MTCTGGCKWKKVTGSERTFICQECGLSMDGFTASELIMDPLVIQEFVFKGPLHTSPFFRFKRKAKP